MEVIREVAKIGDREITLETGKIAKQANSVILTLGDTAVLVAVTMSREPKDLPFMPLTVEFREANAAAGKIPGGYFKREGRPTEKEILTCRLTDRPIRPLFPKGYRYDTQVIAHVLSHDLQNEPDVLAMTGASAGLMLSPAPWAGPVAGIRVARVDGELIAFPTFDEIGRSDLNLIVSCSRDAIVMVEAGAEQVSEAEMIDALMFAKEQSLPLIEAQERLRERAGKTKLEWVEPEVDTAFRDAVMGKARERMVAALEIFGKHERHEAISALKGTIIAELGEDGIARRDEVGAALGKLEKQIVRKNIVAGKRLGGRGPADIRDLFIEIHPFERPHGSALFQRGETQAIVTTTLGTERDAQRLDTIRGDINNTFLLHYNFPPYSVGEARPMRGTSRREIGHGALAHRAIETLLPDSEAFPYTIRVVSDTTESNGSSSMAAVCGGCLSLMDAGVPIEAPVAGIAMGLIQEGEDIVVLSDILGDEDHLGDMDFKCCGTAKGITALQMDIKIHGLTREILERALEQARLGRLHILEAMLAKIEKPREEISRYAPRVESMWVKIDKIRSIIGPGGKVIRGITEQTGVVININDDGRVTLASADIDAIERAKAIIEGLTFEAEPGQFYNGVVKRIVDFGAFVEIMPGTDGLVHISELENRRVDQVTDVLSEGDDVVVKVINVDDTGRIRLSRKQAFGVDPDEVLNLR
ncbi:polyribonucleotide nucleotidyltransferase [Pseudenhygromyxa sp. WMMC2535]|uniref:polyribonucleotide nucleotidyltransferase n=1 Tax=Pseudenhygromyxa sp. WMMC2535 TaxID=2712867 RepID=UPI001554EEB9|nr:polyribonucleotide nucleotidyltransferase [Pseudenhygromyxa sp. WMMC2535]NVB41574.1 polyribonucleotide nucleotidyltransferase [Pseudenhygromyxa sp. WMMC2535]